MDVFGVSDMWAWKCRMLVLDGLGWPAGGCGRAEERLGEGRFKGKKCM
jgi:hypothetical protein